MEGEGERERTELKRERVMVRGSGANTQWHTPVVVVACGDAQHAGPTVLLRLPQHPGCFLS